MRPTRTRRSPAIGCGTKSCPGFVPHNRPLDEVLARTAELARDEEAYWSAEIDPSGSIGTLERSTKAVLVNAEELSELPRAVQRRLIRRAVFRVKGNLREINLFHIEALLSLAAQREGHGRYQAPGLDVFRSFEWLRFAQPRTESRWERDYCVELRWPGFAAIPGQSGIVCIEVAENTEYSHPAEGYNTEGRGSIPSLIDADRFSGPLELRNWRPGDQFQRLGHSIEKIKTLFQFARIPIWDRQGWPVITSGEKDCVDPEIRSVLRICSNAGLPAVILRIVEARNRFR